MTGILRNTAIAFGSLLEVLGIFGVFAEPSTWPFLITAIAVLIGIIFERKRYGAAIAEPPAGDDWTPTAERFIDETGAAVRVWYNPRDGARRYVADDSAPE